MNISTLANRLALGFAVIMLPLVLLAGCSSSPDYHAHDISGLLPNLEFELTNENGKRVDESDYDQARVNLMYFGYTHCPDICPMTLATISSAIASLDKSVRDDINVLFVSVDPKRDTPKRLKTYTQYFGPQFIGLTGTQEQLQTLTKHMRVTYGYGEPNENGFYPVSHSSAVFVFDHQGEARLLFDKNQTVEQIAQDLKTLLSHTS